MGFSKRICAGGRRYGCRVAQSKRHTYRFGNAIRDGDFFAEKNMRKIRPWLDAIAKYTEHKSKICAMGVFRSQTARPFTIFISTPRFLHLLLPTGSCPD